MGDLSSRMCAEHRAFFLKHVKAKGREAAAACLAALEAHARLAA